MKKAIIIILTALATNVFAQTKKVHISVMQGISIQGSGSKDTDYVFSFNLFSGAVRSIKGVEIGSLYNQNEEDMTGFQCSGLINFTKGRVKGYQTAGLSNISGTVIGWQEAGLSNHAKELIGIQTSGIVNIAQYVRGLQLTGICNKAKTLKGYQIGLINMADSVEKGGGIGLVNLYKKGGYREIEVSAADYQHIGLSFKSGIRALYSIVNIGYNFNPKSLFSIGAGFGRLTQLKNNWFFKPEILWYNYVTDDFSFNTSTHSSHFKLGIMKKVGKMGFTVSPSIYYANIPRNLEGILTEISSIKPFAQAKNGRWGYGLSFGISFLK